MGEEKRQRGLDITLLVLGLFFLAMGLTDITEDDFGVVLGFGVGLSLLGAYIWRRIMRRKGRFAPAGWGCIALFAAALFFLMMTLEGLVSGDETGTIIGLVFGGALAALYVLRRREELRRARAAEAERQSMARVQTAAMRVERPQTPAQTGLTICPHCGAPAKEKICPYCGMEK